ncbi:hypothetical protein [Niabella drilacis]|uniref:Uncharacterized protein n=1 Tax=Niabella drilacis (strain DSM 25811 / CCM 8410 / CCUG 62505 / LMG 26954 / E90) TaxID=1285928 RepID=A0A1G6KPL4_NIADE|nr:hypothetical protein [Niabella drilacis]SDC32768.1 hypothetical protein SAMN04487894_10249 [Niabella drilacis]
MNIIQSKASFIQFTLDPDTAWTRIDMIVGENFRTLGDSFQLNTTPLTDATLVPFSNFQIVDQKTLILDVAVNTSLSRYQIDLTKHKAGLAVAQFIEAYNAGAPKIKTAFSDSIKIETDKQFFKFQIEDISYDDTNIENKKWLIISRNKYGVYVQIKEPLIAQRRYEQVKSVELRGHLLKVACAGEDLWNETASETPPLPYTWKLNVQPEFAEIVTTLLTICIEQLNK